MTSETADRARICTSEQTQLGEGTRWDARRGELLRVDIVAGRVIRNRVASDGDLEPVRTYELQMPVGAVAPVQGDDGWLVAAGRGVVYLDPDGRWLELCEPVPAGSRMNDAACDPQGRFWAGSIADDHRPGAGEVYRIDRSGAATTVLSGMTIPNGMGWSPDGRTMYVIDSGPRQVRAYAFDAATGNIGEGATLVEVPAEVGAPDGMTVDANGDLWVAIYGGGRVQHYAPDGTLREELHVPASQTTCCAFAGPGLRTLYVSTATENWTDEQRRAEPTAGRVYRFDTVATGRPASPFVPETGWWSTFKATNSWKLTAP